MRLVSVDVSLEPLFALKLFTSPVVSTVAVSEKVIYPRTYFHTGANSTLGCIQWSQKPLARRTALEAPVMECACSRSCLLPIVLSFAMTAKRTHDLYSYMYEAQ